MSLTIVENTTTDYTPPDAGSFTAQLASVIDLGTQQSVWEGEEKRLKKVQFVFEITDGENRRDDGQAHVISKRFTASLHAKSALRRFLEAWRGRPFTTEELAGFNLSKLVGMPCLLGVVHETKGEKTFANISTVMKLPKGITPPAGTLPLQFFDLAQPDWDTFARLSSRLQGLIAESPEYAAIPNKPKTIAVTQAPATAAPQRPATAPTAQHQPEPPAYASEFAPAFEDSDIPF